MKRNINTVQSLEINKLDSKHFVIFFLDILKSPEILDIPTTVSMGSVGRIYKNILFNNGGSINPIQVDFRHEECIYI